MWLAEGAQQLCERIRADRQVGASRAPLPAYNLCNAPSGALQLPLGTRHLRAGGRAL